MRHSRNDSSHNVYLLDTMNNVLGMLILVLILTQVIGVSERGMKVVPEEQLQAMRVKLRHLLAKSGTTLDQITDQTLFRRQLKMQERYATCVQKLTSLAATDKAVDPKLGTKLSDVVQTVASADQALNNVKSRAYLEEQTERYRQQLADARDKWQASQKQLKDLHERIATGGQVLSIGHGRGAEVPFTHDTTVTLVIHKAQVGLLDWDAINAQLHAANQQWLNSNPQSGMSSFASFVNSGDWGDGSFRIGLEPFPDGSGVFMVPLPRYNDKWASTKSPADLQSRVQKKLTGLDPKKTLVKFVVYNDSFKEYVDLVQFIRKQGFKTSWVPMDEGEPIFSLVRASSHPNQNSTHSNSTSPVDPD